MPLNVPATHSVGVLAPASHQLPASHASHAVAPGDGWNVPASQGAHVALPSAAATRPAAHALGAVAPLAHDEPAGHSAQSACDAPPGEPRHEPSAHSVTELAGGSQKPPAVHASHAVAFDDDWNVPPAHSRHAPSPLAFDRKPGAHAIGSLELGGQ